MPEENDVEPQPNQEPSSWLEVSLVVDGEMAEAAAEVIARFAPNGVAIESTQIAPEPEGSGHVTGPLRVAGYLPVDEALEDKRRRLEEALWYLGRIRPLPAPEYRTVAETDWAEAWKVHYQPIPIGRRLVIVPAWLDSPDPARIPVRMDPGMAFGTGTHPTTQLCLEYVEDLVGGIGEAQPVRTIIDVGCGSGILAIAGLKLGAERAVGVDVDRLAVRVARENAALNGVAERFELGPGSAPEIRAGQFSLTQADLVLANILAPVLVRLLDDGLGELLEPHSSLVLSGIIDTQVESVMEAAGRSGLELADQRQINDWVALRLVRPR